MSETTLSKSDLEEICRGLRISTEGTKTDLIQRIRGFMNEGSQGKSEQAEKAREITVDDDDEDEIGDLEYPNIENEVIELDPQLQTLREIVQKSKGKTKATSSKTTAQKMEGQDLNDQGSGDKHKNPKKSKKRHFQDEGDNEGSETLEHKMLLEFRRLEKAVLGFNEKLNSVTAQIQDTRQRVEINDIWPNYKFESFRDQHEYDTLRLVGKELDLAVDSRNVHDTVKHIEDA